MSELDERIPNNVNLSQDPKLKRALEKWQPNFLEWWKDMGPEGFQADEVYLRTAVSVEPAGWAHFDFTRMPDYRWGIFLTPAERDRTIGFGDFEGQPAWQTVPGEFRTQLRRLIVTQGDTEPASVEQQRQLGKTAPSMYDLRNLFQVNVEEGRHLWAMVYLLHSYFGRDGREEAEGLLERRSGNPDKPRLLGAFNAPCDDWLNFYMFTMFTDRDGKFQLLALSESGFDPLSRTCRFMLTEEAFHMSVGDTGVGRIVERTAQIMREGKEDVRREGAIDLPTIQKYLNFWFSISLDLFGGEVSTNAAQFFAAGLKGRYKEQSYSDHKALDAVYEMDRIENGRPTRSEVPLRNAMNEVLRDAYVEDCQKGVDRWNRILEQHGLSDRFSLPHRRFNRQIGAFAGYPFDPGGDLLSEEQWKARRDEWLPSANDQAYVATLMKPVYEVGKIANWIAPPQSGVKGKPFAFEYVRKHE
ncbi:MAG TPA: benzoyl-CoA 2,3-epoxidase subunit BoxB [Vicinamibacteria bacterium]